MSQYWFSRGFHCYLALGKSNGRKLFEWEQWKLISPNLDRFFARPDTIVETAQFDLVTDRAIPFRKLGWNSKSHAKWTLNSPVTVNLPSRHFITAQIWAPGQKICAEKEIAPDVFAEIRSFGAEAFNEGIMIAVAEDLNVTIARTFTAIVSQMTTVFLGYQRAPWGETIGDGIGYTNCLSDFMGLGIPYHDKEIVATNLRGHWSEFAIQSYPIL